MEISHIVDLMWKNISEASTATQKGLAFYLALLAGTTGYIFSANLSDDKKLIVFCAALSISFFAAVAIAALGWGIWIGLREISSVVSSGQIEDAKAIYEDFNKRGARVGLIGMACSFLVLITILVSLVVAVV